MIINIRQFDSRVVDVNQTYDPRYFDNAVYPDGTIPANADPTKYIKTPLGAIVAQFETRPENLAALRQAALALLADPTVPVTIKDFVRALRKVL